MTLCYVVMCVLCFWYGNRYFPIPYRFMPLFLHTAAAITVVYISYQFSFENFILDSAVNIGITLIYILILWLLEKKKLMVERN